MNELHLYQRQILKKFIYQPMMTYGGMKPSSLMENNKFQFHLDQLKEKGLVEQIGTSYRLTNSGKMIVAKMDAKKGIIKTQAKIGAAMGGVRTLNGKREILFYTRLKQPFFGCQGFAAGKAEYGEKFVETARREFEEETGLLGTPVLVAVTHYITTQKGNVVDDLLLFLYKIENPTGKLNGCDEGKYEWVEEDKIKDYLMKPFQSREQFLEETKLILDFDGQVQVKEVVWEDEDEKTY